MFVNYDTSEHYQELNKRSKELLSSILKGVALEPQRVRLERDEELFAGGRSREMLYVIQEGYFQCLYRSKLLFFLEAGDMLGVGGSFERELEVSSEFVVVLDAYDREAFLKIVTENPAINTDWWSYLATNWALRTELLEVLTKKDFRIDPNTQVIEPGETIIAEGEEPDTFYTLIEGEADVYIQGDKIGEVLSGEMFGVMGFALGCPRVATVIARTPCLVMIVSKENFLSLVQTHPDAVIKVIENLSRIIVSQNSELRDLKAKC